MQVSGGRSIDCFSAKRFCALFEFQSFGFILGQIFFNHFNIPIKTLTRKVTRKKTEVKYFRVEFILQVKTNVLKKENLVLDSSNNPVFG